MAAALILLVPVVCWAALQVNQVYVKILDDNSHIRSSLHAIVNSATAIHGQLQLTKQIAESNHEQVKALVGGGAALPIAPLAQSDAQLPTGGIDPAWATDCGETCVAMLVANKRGVPIGVARVRYLLGKPSGDGRTTADDLVTGLSMCGIKSHKREVDYATMLTEVRHNLAAGRSSIVLGDWINRGVQHWMEAIQDTGDGIVFDDPWIGAHRYESDGNIYAGYKGVYVHVDE